MSKFTKDNIGLALASISLVVRGGKYPSPTNGINNNTDVADCQHFVERSLRLIGINRDYYGSNHMIRELVPETYPINESNMKIGDIVFWVRTNNNEPDKYKLGGSHYDPRYDGKNASHVGIYIGYGKVAESGSSIGHWAITDLRKRGANYYGRVKGLSYKDENNYEVRDAINNALGTSISSSSNTSMSTPNTNNPSEVIMYAQVNPSGKYVNLRTEPDLTSSVLAQMAPSDTMLVHKTTPSRWRDVTYKGIRGWCKASLTPLIDASKLVNGIPTPPDLDDIDSSIDDDIPEGAEGLGYIKLDDTSEIVRRLSELELRVTDLEDALSMKGVVEFRDGKFQ